MRTSIFAHNSLGKRAVQTDSCLQSEQINTLLISVGGQVRGGWEGGGHLGSEAQKLHVTVRNAFDQCVFPTCLGERQCF